MDTKLLDNLARQLTESLPEGLRVLQHDLENSMQAGVKSIFSKLDLVTREEFDIQAAVLARTRAKLEALEKQIAALEPQMQPTATVPPAENDVR